MTTPPNSKEELRKRIAQIITYNAKSIGPVTYEKVDAILAEVESHTDHLLTEAFAAVRPEPYDTINAGLHLSDLEKAYNNAIADLDANIKRYMEEHPQKGAN